MANKPSSVRHVTLAWFVCGYVGLWLLVGVALMVLAGWLTVSSERIAAAVALVALWHCSPARQRCLNACHRVPTLRVFGTAAQWDSLRYGVSTGWDRAGACGLAMLLVLLAQGPSPPRHGPCRCRGHSRAAFAREAPWLAASHRARPITGVAPMPVATRGAGFGWR